MRDSTTRKILLTKTPTPLKLYTPPFLIDEVYKYKDLLAKKAMLNKNEVLGLILQLIYASGIEIIDYRYLDKFKKDAPPPSMPSPSPSSPCIMCLTSDAFLYPSTAFLSSQAEALLSRYTAMHFMVFSILPPI